jgi:hypothetical protein
MTAHDSARPRASLIPPLLVLLPRFPPSPLLSAGPGLGRRGAPADGDGGRTRGTRPLRSPGPLRHWRPGLMCATQPVLAI